MILSSIEFIIATVACVIFHILIVAFFYYPLPLVVIGILISGTVYITMFYYGMKDLCESKYRLRRK